jgi:hypothetical protein
MRGQCCLQRSLSQLTAPKRRRTTTQQAAKKPTRDTRTGGMSIFLETGRDYIPGSGWTQDAGTCSSVLNTALLVFWKCKNAKGKKKTPDSFPGVRGA